MQTNPSWQEVWQAMQGRRHASPNTPRRTPKPLSKRGRVIAVVVAVLVVAFLYWLIHPSLNIQSPGLWFFVCVFIMLPWFLYLRSKMQGASKRAETDVSAQPELRRYRRLRWIPLAVIAIWLLGALLSATFFPGNAHRYASIIQTTEYNYTDDISQVDYSSIPVIDRDSAILLGNRTMGSMADYVSQFEISDLYSQIAYKGAPVRVSPLNYADFFKWITNRKDGLPAYVVVDMATQDTQVVRLDQGMCYSESEPFNRNIERYVQLTHPFYMFDQFSFEIDEEGHPYWICPVQRRTIGLFGGTTIDRVVLCDACTGECFDYAISDVPEWVDRAYPADLLITQYNWSGRYIHGWWNSWIGQAGVYQATPGSENDLGYNYLVKDNDIWVYTGVTSATSDNSIIGFVLINQRTGESRFYSVAGATETSAMNSAEGQVQNLGYQATFPLLLNINGRPTYFMALKDNAGLVKKYAMIDIERYQNVAIGDTVSDCEKSYKSLLATNGLASEESTGESRATGTIAHIAEAVIDGNSHFYVTLAGDEHIYDCALPGMIEAVALQEGQSVTFSYQEGSPTCTVTAIER
jgi:hypothetical protein